MPTTQQAIKSVSEPSDPGLAGLLRGYRFRVCETAEAARKALDIRRRVYVDASGYRLPIPDAYDTRSWLLLAEEDHSGQPVGSMRLTPRFAGPLEAEEYFTLPRELRSPWAVEINRFAILPAYRKGKLFLPVVSLGLFKLVMRFLQTLDAEHMVIASKPERVWTYEWMRFKRTGLTARYAKLDYTEHELLSYDFRRAVTILEGHPFRDFFVELEYSEVVMPTCAPALGLGMGGNDEAFQFQASA